MDEPEKVEDEDELKNKRQTSLLRRRAATRKLRTLVRSGLLTVRICDPVWQRPMALLQPCRSASSCAVPERGGQEQFRCDPPANALGRGVGDFGGTLRPE